MKKALLVLCLLSSVLADELKRPTHESAGVMTGAGCGGFGLSPNSIPLAYDAGGPSTSSTLSVSSGFAIPKGLGIGSRTQQGTKRLTQWTSTTNVFSSLTLNILSSGAAADGTGGTACLAYSLNSGSSWTAIRCSGGVAWSNVTDSVTLSPTQDLTTLQFAACAQANGNNPDNISTESIQLFDVWTLGTTTPQGAGNGSTAGQPHRGLVIVN